MEEQTELEKLIFAYLNVQDFEIINASKHIKLIYFVYDKNDSHAKIMYSNNMVVISKELSNEIKSYFNITDDDASFEITNWIESKLNVKINIWDVKVYGGMIGDYWLSVNDD